MSLNNNVPCTQEITVDQDCLFLTYLDNCEEARIYPPLRLYEDDNFVYVNGADNRQLSWAKDCPVIIDGDEYPVYDIEAAKTDLLVHIGCVNKSRSAGGGGGSFDDTRIVTELQTSNTKLNEPCDGSPQNVVVCNLQKEDNKFYVAAADEISYDEEFNTELSITSLGADGLDQTLQTTTLQGQTVSSLQNMVNQLNSAQTWVVFSIPTDLSIFPSDLIGFEEILCIEPSSASNALDLDKILNLSFELLNVTFDEFGDFYAGDNNIQCISNGVEQANKSLDLAAKETTLAQVVANSIATNALLTQLLNENKIDFELAAVEDANGDIFRLVFEKDESTGNPIVSYIDANGNPATPVNPVSYLSPNGLLSDIKDLLTIIEEKTQCVEFTYSATFTGNALISLPASLSGRKGSITEINDQGNGLVYYDIQGNPISTITSNRSSGATMTFGEKKVVNLDDFSARGSSVNSRFVITINVLKD